jgi:hypothetical protein
VIEQHTLFDEPQPGEFEIPAGAEVVKCRSCGASIVWGRTPKGASVPINVDQVRMVAGRGYGRTHFATCPDATGWRRQG